MNEPLVSVIVPNYNHSAYLMSRIDSILAQDFDNFELILLDDCSTDNSRDILLKYQSDNRVTHIVFNEQNSGTTFKQWDKGLLLARGKYIWIAESDDFAEKNFLTETVTALEGNPDVVLAFTGSQMVDADGQHLALDWDKFSSKLPLQTKFASRDFLIKNMLWGPSVYNASMVLFRKECYAKVNGGYKEFRYCGDWLFWIEMARQGSVVELYEKLNLFRLHSTSTTVEGNASGNAILEDIQVVHYVECFSYPIGCYKRLMRHGMLYKNIKRAKVDPKMRLLLFEKLKGCFGTSVWTYRWERVNKYMSFLNPWQPTRDRERL